jgi:hypothetical protein
MFVLCVYAYMDGWMALSKYPQPCLFVSYKFSCYICMYEWMDAHVVIPYVSKRTYADIHTCTYIRPALCQKEERMMQQSQTYN